MRLAPLLQPLTEPLLSPLVTAITGASGGGFSPISLFTASDKGYIFDNNDLTSFYLDSAGTTPATVNGLVGLQFDKSQNVAIGAELVPSGNYTGTVDGGFSFSGRTIVRSGTAVNGALLDLTTTVVIGAFYRVTMDVTGITGDTLVVRVGNSGGATFHPITANGSYSFLAQATLTNARLQVTGLAGTTGTATISNISVKLVSGNHRYQTTTGSKPILRGTPVGGNIVTNGDFASETGWTLGTGWAIGSGTLNATAVTTGQSAEFAGAGVVSGNVYRIRYTISGYTAGGVSIFLGTAGAARSANGTYEEYLTATASGAATFIRRTSNFTGSIDNVEIVNVSAGQVTAPYGLQYDGVDDFLQTASVDFTATDKMAVVMGVRKLSDGARAVVVELGTAAAAGIFRLEAPNSAAGNNYNFASGGSTLVAIAVGVFTSPITNVVTCLGNIAGDSASVRVNGVLAGTEPGDQGTGNYSNNILYFGRRGGTTLPYNGLDFGGVCVGKTLTATQLANIERWVNQRTGAY